MQRANTAVRKMRRQSQSKQKNKHTQKATRTAQQQAKQKRNRNKRETGKCVPLVFVRDIYTDADGTNPSFLSLAPSGAVSADHLPGHWAVGGGPIDKRGYCCTKSARAGAKFPTPFCPQIGGVYPFLSILQTLNKH